jgi:hypothetical protein
MLCLPGGFSSLIVGNCTAFLPPLFEKFVPLSLLASDLEWAGLLLFFGQLINCHAMWLVSGRLQDVFFQAGSRECSA